MRVKRKDNSLNDTIELLDEKFRAAQIDSKTDNEVYIRAWESLDDDEMAFTDRETGACMTDRRYFMENYYIIRNEEGQLQTLHPFWDHQELIYEAVESDWKTEGCVRRIILKPRQAGSTTWNGALIFHDTIFVPNSYTLAMAQDTRVSGEIFERMMDAYHNLPWWLKPEILSKQRGMHVIFQRADEGMRNIDPGLGSTLLVSDSQKSTGVAIGRTIKNLLGSEVSRWPDPAVWTADIEPSLNAKDMLGILESTAFGRTGLYWNMWNSAMEGESIWKPLFVPVYRVTKYYLPVYKSENFSPTADEKALRTNVKHNENFTIPLGFFKWRRRKILNTIGSTGSDETHFESYPCTPTEAFISSGFCAFPRKELNRQQRVHCRNPIAVGEIEFTSMDTAPVLHVHPPTPDELKKKPSRENRFWLWEYPEPESSGIEYYVACDVGGGGEGHDFSDAVVFRLGYGNEPDVEVAGWHGHINPSHLARVLAAIGHLYHDAELAVEYAQSGITTGDELRWSIDYPNLYRWKQMDKISGTTTMHIHWVTNSRTRDDAINRMGERLLDHTIVLRNAHAIEEMRDFGRYEGESKAAAMSGNDDMAMSRLICICAAHQSGKRQEMEEARGMGAGANSGLAGSVMPKVPVRYAIYNHYSQFIQEVDTEAEGRKIIAAAEKHVGVKLNWRIVPVTVMKANTPWSVLDNNGASRELDRDHGIGPRDTMANPGILDIYRELLTRQRHEGKSSQGDYNDE